MHIQYQLYVNDQIHKELIEYDVIQTIYLIHYYRIFLKK